MVANKHISKIIIAVMALAVVLCLLAVVFSSSLSLAFGGTSVTMEYETELFNTDEIIDINIKMDDDEWEKMLSNAMTEEYYSCDVTVNGKTFRNVGIRPKGNTSLSAIAMDPDTDRYSLKLEFGHFVEGQTCYGLDKLILNNNYADATNMKEAVIYDMFQYIGAEASLYNYAKVSLNNEYRGVYLALEAVEQSFMLRNFGTQDGELYKPDTMEMGGNDSKSSSSSKSNGGASFGGFPGGNFDMNNIPDMGDFDPNSIPDGGSFDMGNMPDMGNFDPGSMQDFSGFGGRNSKDGGSSDSKRPSRSKDSGKDDTASETKDSDSDKSSRPSGGFSMGGGGGANLNYSDDDLDSYQTIWDSEITETSTGDHRRVVTALKNISEGTDLEKYLDVDNVLKYMAVHTFAVNMDSLSGSMSHNYYLYEYDGKLNIFPWDYNLSLGGMGMGGSSDGTSVINDAIDTPFSGTHFFDALLENEEYLERYHKYLQQLTDEYVEGGRFDEVYNRIRGQIDELVETDPTAFYSGSEYQEAADILYDTIKLRAQSIKGQLDGSIPSTDKGQQEDSSALIDGSSLDISAMGQFSMGGGGGGFGGFGGFSRNSDRSDSDSKEKAEGEGNVELSEADTDSEEDSIELPANIKENKRRPSFSGMPQQTSPTDLSKNLAVYGICLAVMVVMLFVVKGIKRRK